MSLVSIGRVIAILTVVCPHITGGAFGDGGVTVKEAGEGDVSFRQNLARHPELLRLPNTSGPAYRWVA